MKYWVRNKDGELEYPSFKELQEAARVGFVEANDDIRAESETGWKKVATVRGLFKSQPRWLRWAHPLLPWVILAVVGAGLAGWAIHRGNVGHDPEFYAYGLVCVFAVLGILFKVTSEAQKPRR